MPQDFGWLWRAPSTRLFARLSRHLHMLSDPGKIFGKASFRWHLDMLINEMGRSYYPPENMDAWHH